MTSSAAVAAGNTPGPGAPTSRARLEAMLPWVLVAIAALRLIHLDADPGLIKSLLNNASDVGDEGYWAAAARNLVLFNTLGSDDYLQAATSPFYTVLLSAGYWVFGVSMYTTRLPNAVLGIAAVVLVYRLFEPYSKPAAFVAGLSLALENNFFIHTRMGQVEAACGFFGLLAFYLLIRSKTPLLAGIALGLAIATKIVALLLAPAFALFLLLQWVRSRVSWPDVLKFGAGLAVVGVLMLVFMQSQGASVVRNPFRIVADFVGGYDVTTASRTQNALNTAQYEDAFTKNLVMQSQGVAILKDPARTLINFFSGFYLSYPSVTLLVVLFAGYAWRARLALWIGNGASARIGRATDVEIMIVAWLVGFAVSMIFLSDMHHRRMNMFSIPLAMVPGLFLLRRPEPAHDAPAGIQIAVLCAPVVMLAALVGRRVVQATTPLNTGWSLLIAATAAIVVAAALAPQLRHRSAAWWDKAGLPVLLAWVALAALSLTYHWWFIMSTNLEVAGRGAKVAGLVALATAMLLAAVSARTRPRALIGAVLIVGAALDLHDLAFTSFSARDASLQVRALTSSSDYGVGDGAHVLSLNAPYRAVQAYPRRGVNREFVARTRPRFLFRETDHRDKRINDPSWTEFSITEGDLYAIGASKVEQIAEFPLYPVRRMPGETTYRLYQVTY